MTFREHRWAMACALATSATLAFGQSHDQVNEANNPLTPKLGVNFQDQYVRKAYDVDDWTNAFLFRSTIPHRIGGAPQIARVTAPVVTAPSFDGDGRTTAFGDVNVFDLFLSKHGPIEIGLGPQLTAPTASKDEGGTGKWQAGIALAVVAPQSWGLAGGLVTWQHSFAGDDDRATQNNAALQPFFIVNLPQGWYLRSTATWTFDLARDHYAIPLGLGVGKVWVLGDGTSVNLFAEPQWTVAHDGAGQPKFQVFAGVNLQLPIRR